MNCPVKRFFPRFLSHIVSGRPLKVGWIIEADRAGFIYDEPVRVKSEMGARQHVKSAARCPAVLDMEARFFSIGCPFDIHLQLVKDDKKQWQLKNLAGPDSAIRQSFLSKEVHLMPQAEWRHPDRPMIQITAPYRFITDETAYLTQCAPFMHYNNTPWPGVVFGGRFPVHIWPRTLMWAFEWHDTSKPLNIKRGTPWFYVGFEAQNPQRRVKLVAASMTDELNDYIKNMASVPNYINQTFSLFKVAQSRRPQVLLKERKI